MVLLGTLATAPQLARGYEPHLIAIAVPDASCQPCAPEAADASVVPTGYAWPVQGAIVRRFGEASDGTRSDGLDIAAQEGTPVLAAQSGRVVYAGHDLASYGNLLLVAHPQGFMTVYAHNDALLVRVGQSVWRGQPIATVGHTGDVAEPVLHFQLRAGIQPLDPSLFLEPSDTILTADVH